MKPTHAFLHEVYYVLSPSGIFHMNHPPKTLKTLRVLEQKNLMLS